MEWPNTGTTTARPRSNGSEPSASSIATISPHTAIVSGFAATTRTEVSTASTAPTSRSSSNGNEITLMVSTSTANRKPTALPTTMSDQPAGVVKTRLMKSGIDAAGS